ncbi:oxygen-independent coproporphyrinogen III oxidase [Bacterioplanoides sp. SCSIO 12839]|uniref:oxygen-independent coproporphyrinogen III oxidase n=1 Tax=Bacterioplanoides sp. SCSIO 12839 TaxID=2829569 RepID=UPI0021083B58|nr:oxygen-independent coproporphyrinogen III oxidase [Bacterioplanoides sp. SCSIO 12839]UTW49682.1 oxygen-independent coproporphyrinogen III oxidase [Bacterioplanoides sp. SCSIO 12839]
MSEHLQWDPLLIQRYNRPGPRYTSYPTAVEFLPVTGDSFEREAFANRDPQKPLSLYIHIPFCAHVCYYCGCNKIVTKRREQAEPYLELLKNEILTKKQLLGDGRRVEQLHFGGGTPTFLSDEQLQDLIEFLQQHFDFSDAASADYSIEIDPRELRPGTLKMLRQHGFNRISFGVQDLEEQVQIAVNRVQPESMIRAVMAEARELGFGSINMDLIYGLPHQTLESFDRTLDTIIELSPDRLSVFNYAHLPERFKPQRRINGDDLPSAQEKLAILGHCIEKLSNADYHYVGMDHFAKPDDELAKAQANGKLHRNFQGYTTHGDCDLVGFGVSSISQIGDYYLQNQVTVDAYEHCLTDNTLPTLKYRHVTHDDRIRRYIIAELLCHLNVQFAELDRSFHINSRDYLADSLAELQPMIADELVVVDDVEIRITEKGRLLVRNACMAFDSYLKQHEQPQNQERRRFSKAI